LRLKSSCIASHFVSLCRTLYLASSCILAALSLFFNHKHLHITYKTQTYHALCASSFLQLCTIYIVSLSPYKVPLTLLLSSECVLTTITPRTCIKHTSRPVAVFTSPPSFSLTVSFALRPRLVCVTCINTTNSFTIWYTFYPSKLVCC
jgi:hypothetical protein